MGSGHDWGAGGARDHMLGEEPFIRLGEVWRRRRAGDGAGQRTSLEESEPPKCLGRHVCTGLRCLPPKHATRHPPHHTPQQNTKTDTRCATGAKAQGYDKGDGDG